MNRLTSALRALALPALLIALWHRQSLQGASAAYAFVPLADIGRGFAELASSGELLLHLTASLETMFIGLACGSAAGFMLGGLMALSRSADAVLSPLINALRQVPTMGLIPLIALWFGTDQFSIRFLVAIATFEVMTLSAQEGLSAVERRYVELGRALMFTPVQRFARILLPAAFPALLTGLLQAVSLAWMATIGAELLFTVGPGLAVVMERGQIAARMDIVIVCLLFIGLLGFAMNSLCAALGRRVLRWRHSA